MSGYRKGVRIGNWQEEAAVEEFQAPVEKTDYTTASQASYQKASIAQGEQLRYQKATDTEREQGQEKLFGQRADWDKERFQTEYQRNVDALAKETDPFVRQADDTRRNTKGTFKKSIQEETDMKQPVGDDNTRLFRKQTDIHRQTNDDIVQGLRK